MTKSRDKIAGATYIPSSSRFAEWSTSIEREVLNVVTNKAACDVPRMKHVRPVSRECCMMGDFQR